MERFAQFSIAAAGQALQDAGLKIDDSNAWDVGAIIATGGGGIRAVADETETLVTRGWERVGPMMVPLMIPNMASCQVSMRVRHQGAGGDQYGGVRGGRVFAVRGAALPAARRRRCAASRAARSRPSCRWRSSRWRARARSRSATTIRRRPDDRSTRIAMGSCSARARGCWCSRRSSTRRARRAHPGRAGGASITGDAYHVSAPEPSGESARRAIVKAIARRRAAAGRHRLRVRARHRHAAQRLGRDAGAEAGARRPRLSDSGEFRKVDDRAPARRGGALSAVAAVKALETGCVPPTINQFTPDPECDLDYVPWKPAACDSHGAGQRLRLRRPEQRRGF